MYIVNRSYIELSNESGLTIQEIRNIEKKTGFSPKELYSIYSFRKRIPDIKDLRDRHEYYYNMAMRDIEER